MIFDAIDCDRFEGAVADVQRDVSALDAMRGQRVEQPGREMQSGGRRRNRSALARKDGLVALAVRRAVVAPDVRRQRHVPQRIDQRHHAALRLSPEANRSPALEAPFQHLAHQDASRALEPDDGPRLQLLARVHQRFPLRRLSAGRPLAQQ